MSDKATKKIEPIETEDVDCYGNYDKKETQTCLKCGERKNCERDTKNTQNELVQIRSVVQENLANAKDSISKNKIIRKIKKKLKEKEKELEKNMSDEKKKVMKVVKKSDDSENTKVVKLKKKDSGEGEKKKGRKARPDVETLHNTTLPVAFKSLYKSMKGFGDIEKKTSVTNVRGSNGILFCAPIIGRTDDKVELFLNRSKGYSGFKKFDLKNVELKNHKKGEFLVVVKSSQKSQDEAAELLKRWVKDQPSHVASNRSEKSEKGEKTKVKIKKKDASEKSEKGGEKKKAKVPPVVKPVKKSSEVEDEEG